MDGSNEPSSVIAGRLVHDISARAICSRRNDAKAGSLAPDRHWITGKGSVPQCGFRDVHDELNFTLRLSAVKCRERQVFGLEQAIGVF